jgi:hypothetical protein
LLNQRPQRFNPNLRATGSNCARPSPPQDDEPYQ